jgi:hypothetical protein
MAEIKEVVPFNFDDIYENAKAKLQEKGYDAPYEGSQSAQFLTAISYVVSMLNVNTAGNINEMLLTTATKRDNVLNNARLLGYEVEHKTSYTYTLTLTNNSGSTQTLAQYTKFSSSGDSTKTYYYTGETLYIPDGESEDILVKEGNLKKYSDSVYSKSLSVVIGETTDATGTTIPQYYIDIPFVDIEDDGIDVYATYYNDEGLLVEDEEWTKSPQFMIDKDSELNKQFVRLDNIRFKTPRIYFKMAGVGAGLKVGSIVNINVLQTKGSQGAMNDGDINGYDVKSTEIGDLEITNCVLKTEGSEEEDIEDIRVNAPLFHNSANRAITKNDYVSICNRQSSIKVSEVWGGEDEPTLSGSLTNWQPGNIWFSFLPSNSERSFYDVNKTSWFLNKNGNGEQEVDLVNNYVETTEVEDVWGVLDGMKIPTLIFHYRDPVYIDFEYSVQVLKYSAKSSKEVIHQRIFDAINNFFNVGYSDLSKAESFWYEYFQSSLNKRIDAELTDISGFENKLNLSVQLNEKLLIQENENVGGSNYDILIPFGLPFEGIEDIDGTFKPENLPIIGISGLELDEINWSNETIKLVDEAKLFQADINDNGTKIGTYYVVNGTKKYILIHLFVQEHRADDYTTFSELDAITVDPGGTDIPIGTRYKSSIADNSDPDNIVYRYYETILTIKGDAPPVVALDADGNLNEEYFKDVTPSGIYANSTLRVEDIENFKKMTITPISPNISAYKNSIPRLNRISFI